MEDSQLSSSEKAEREKPPFLEVRQPFPQHRLCASHSRRTCEPEGDGREHSLTHACLYVSSPLDSVKLPQEPQRHRKDCQGKSITKPPASGSSGDTLLAAEAAATSSAQMSIFSIPDSPHQGGRSHSPLWLRPYRPMS